MDIFLFTNFYKVFLKSFSKTWYTVRKASKKEKVMMPTHLLKKIKKELLNIKINILKHIKINILKLTKIHILKHSRINILKHIKINIIKTVVTKQEVTEWEISKIQVGNEIEIFITLTKYNTCQPCEEGKPLLVVYYLISILTAPHNSVQHIYDEWDILINVHRFGI